MAVGYSDKSIVAKLQSIVRLLVSSWIEKDRQEQERKEKEDAWFEHKVENEDEQFTKQMKENFPTFEEDFEDLKEKDILNDEQPDVEEISHNEYDLLQQMSDDVILKMFFVYESILLRITKAHWLPASNQKNNIDLISGFRERYNIATAIIVNSGFQLDTSLDAITHNANIVSSELIQQSLLPEEERDSLLINDTFCAPYDIYHDSDVPSNMSSRIILEDFLSRVKEILLQFPDHPTLMKIITVIERILSFPIHSSVMRLVAGLEMLLAVSQDWEINAHRGIALRHNLENVTELILTFRKKELKSWLSCLDVIKFKVETKNVHKWWSHLMTMSCDFLDNSNQYNSDNVVSIEEGIIDSLKKFMETSNVGQFNVRLRLLYTLHCHIMHVPEESPHKLNLLAVTWNLYNFYKYFSSQVQNKIQQLTAPILKEFKNFVKIAKWNDLNFWAVKKSAERTHRALQRHVKLYENCLLTPAKVVFVELNTDPTKSCNVPESIPRLFLCKKNTDLLLDKKAASWITKSRKISRKIMEFHEIKANIVDIRDLIEDIIDHTHDLQKLEIDMTLSKEKQLKESKNFNLRKRKALSDLFKSLQSMGVSYKKGMSVWKDENDRSAVFHVSPLDISTGLLHDRTEMNACTIESWVGCEKYFMKCLIRFTAMKAAFQSPSKELGPENIARCCGTSAHMYSTIIKQRTKLATHFDSLFSFKTMIEQVQHIVRDFQQEDSSKILPEQCSIQKISSLFLEKAEALLNCLLQFRIVLHCCPKSLNVSSSFLNTCSKSLSITRDNQTWNQIDDDMNGIISRIKELVSVYQSMTIQGNNSCIIVYSDLGILEEKSDQFLDLVHHVDKIVQLLEVDDTSSSVTESLKHLLDECRCILMKHCQEIKSIKHDISSYSNTLKSHLPQIISKVQNTLLLSLQAVYKECLLSSESAKDDKLISTSSTKSLNILEKFRINEVKSHMKSLLLEVVNFMNDKVAATIQYPVLQWQYKTEQNMKYVYMYGLANSNYSGFCVPAELSEEMESEGGTEFKDIESGGLGEGQGAKDVSDQIENEDQLDDALKQGDDKKDEEEDSQSNTKEEENGIEMSEDFDGKMDDDQEKTDNQNDDSDSDEQDDEELDKQMGDIEEENTETLDDQLWGSDSEDEENLKDDNTGKGNKNETNPELAAKDDGLQAEDEKDNKDDKSPENEEDLLNNDQSEYEGEVPDSYQEENKQEGEEDMQLPDDLNLDDGEDINPDDGEEDVTEEKMEIEDSKETSESNEEQNEEIKEENVDEQKLPEDPEKTKDIDEAEEVDSKSNIEEIDKIEEQEDKNDDAEQSETDVNVPDKRETSVDTEATENAGKDRYSDPDVKINEESENCSNAENNEGEDDGTGQAQATQSQHGNTNIT
ncbi:Midasin [Nymphon striatum]|nr:Midasin [Nymphon striatum]